MWKLILIWIAILGGILGGTFLLPGMIMGVSESFKRVSGSSDSQLFGYSQQHGIGILPAIIPGMGLFSIVYGGLLPAITHYSGIPTVHTLHGILAGGVIGVFHIIVVKRVNVYATGQQNTDNILSDWFLNGIAGGIVGGIIGTCGGFLLGTADPALVNLNDTFDRDRLAGGSAVATSIFLGIAGIFLGIIVGVVFSLLIRVLLPVAGHIQEAVISILSPFLGFLMYTTVLCHSCFLYSHPGSSQYDNGIRYCEHCNTRIPRTTDPGKLLVMFGAFHPKRRKRVFFLMNPDFVQRTSSVEVSEVHIDTKTCDRGLIERFITYIINYPPTSGVQSVPIFYKGKLDELGGNLKNALQNTFKDIQRLE